MEFDNLGPLFKAISYFLICLLYANAVGLMFLWAWLGLDALRAQIEIDPVGIVSLSPVPISRAFALQLWDVASTHWQVTVPCIIGLAVFGFILLRTLSGLKSIVLDIFVPLFDVYTDFTVVFKYMFTMHQFLWGSFALFLLFLEPLWNCISSSCSNTLPSVIEVQRIACTELWRRGCCNAMDPEQGLKIAEHKFMESVLESMPQFNMQGYITWWMLEQKAVCSNSSKAPSDTEYWKCDVAHEDAWQVESFQYTSLAISLAMMVYGTATWTLKCYPEGSQIKKPCGGVLVYFMCLARCYRAFSQAVLLFFQVGSEEVRPAVSARLFFFHSNSIGFSAMIGNLFTLHMWVHLFDPQQRTWWELGLRGFTLGFVPVMTPLPGYGALEVTAMKLQRCSWLVFFKLGILWEMVQGAPFIFRIGLAASLVSGTKSLVGLGYSIWIAAKFVCQPSVSITGLVLHLSPLLNNLMSMGIDEFAVQGLGRWAEPKSEVANSSYSALGASNPDEHYAE